MKNYIKYFFLVLVVIVISSLYFMSNNKILKLDITPISMTVRNGNTGEVTIISDKYEVQSLVEEINKLSLKRQSSKTNNSTGWTLIIDINGDIKNSLNFRHNGIIYNGILYSNGQEFKLYDDLKYKYLN